MSEAAAARRRGQSGRTHRGYMLYVQCCGVIIFGSYFTVLALNVTLTRKIYRVIYTYVYIYLYIWHTPRNTHHSAVYVQSAQKLIHTHRVPIYCVRAYYEYIYYIIICVVRKRHWSQKPEGGPAYTRRWYIIYRRNGYARVIIIYTHIQHTPSCVSITHYRDRGLCKVVYEKYNI